MTSPKRAASTTKRAATLPQKARRIVTVWAGDENATYLTFERKALERQVMSLIRRNAQGETTKVKPRDLHVNRENNISVCAETITPTGVGDWARRMAVTAWLDKPRDLRRLAKWCEQAAAWLEEKAQKARK